MASPQHGDATDRSETPPIDPHDVNPDDLYALADWHASQPFNRDGADKTYVLKCLHNMQQFVRAARTAKRVERDD